MRQTYLKLSVFLTVFVFCQINGFFTSPQYPAANAKISIPVQCLDTVKGPDYAELLVDEVERGKELSNQFEIYLANQ